MELKDKIIEYFFNLLNEPHISDQWIRFEDLLEKTFKDLGYNTYKINGNLVVEVPATGEFKDKPALIIQTNLDMPAIIEEGIDFDFSKDKLVLGLDENAEYISAYKTNFGAGSAIGIIYMLLLLQDDDFQHPEMVFILTRDKEFAMSGASKLDLKEFGSAKYLINLDTGSEGNIIIGGSGSEVLSATYTFEKKLTLGAVFDLKVSGLTGSWKNQYETNTIGNPVKILAHILSHIFLMGNHIQIVDIDCKPNLGRTPDQGTIRIITTLEEEQLIELINGIIGIILPCYSYNDPHLKFVVAPVSKADKIMAFDRQSTANILFNLMFLPNGVEFSNDGTPLASSDILYCFTEDNNVRVAELIRFLNANYNGFLKSKITMFYSYSHAFYQESEVIPPWSPIENSKLQTIAKDAWRELTGNELTLSGLNGITENGFFSVKLPNLDIISLGPTVLNPNTAYEALDLNSAVRVYQYLKQIIQKIAKEES